MEEERETRRTCRRKGVRRGRTPNWLFLCTGKGTLTPIVFFEFLGVVSVGTLTGVVLMLFLLVLVARCVFHTVSLWFLDVVFCSCLFLSPGVYVQC